MLKTAILKELQATEKGYCVKSADIMLPAGQRRLVPELRTLLLAQISLHSWGDLEYTLREEDWHQIQELWFPDAYDPRCIEGVAVARMRVFYLAAHYCYQHTTNILSGTYYLSAVAKVRTRNILIPLQRPSNLLFINDILMLLALQTHPECLSARNLTVSLWCSLAVYLEHGMADISLKTLKAFFDDITRDTIAMNDFITDDWFKQIAGYAHARAITDSNPEWRLEIFASGINCELFMESYVMTLLRYQKYVPLPAKQLETIEMHRAEIRACIYHNTIPRDDQIDMDITELTWIFNCFAYHWLHLFNKKYLREISFIPHRGLVVTGQLKLRAALFAQQLHRYRLVDALPRNNVYLRLYLSECVILSNSVRHKGPRKLWQKLDADCTEESHHILLLENRIDSIPVEKRGAITNACRFLADLGLLPFLPNVDAVLKRFIAEMPYLTPDIRASCKGLYQALSLLLMLAQQRGESPEAPHFTYYLFEDPTALSADKAE